EIERKEHVRICKTERSRRRFGIAGTNVECPGPVVRAGIRSEDPSVCQRPETFFEARIIVLFDDNDAIPPALQVLIIETLECRPSVALALRLARTGAYSQYDGQLARFAIEPFDGLI